MARKHYNFQCCYKRIQTLRLQIKSPGDNNLSCALFAEAPIPPPPPPRPKRPIHRARPPPPRPSPSPHSLHHVSFARFPSPSNPPRPAACRLNGHITKRNRLLNNSTGTRRAAGQPERCTAAGAAAPKAPGIRPSLHNSLIKFPSV